MSPTTVVDAVQGGRVAARMTFPTAQGRSAFTLTLPAGTYELRLPGLAVRAPVAKVQTHVIFPDPKCT